MGNPAWVVKKVIPREDYTLLLTFEDGKTGIYDLRPICLARYSENSRI